MMTSDQIKARRRAEVKDAARRVAPQADADACTAALLVCVFDVTVRDHLRATQPKLWEQILDALGPLVGANTASLDSAAL